MSLVVAFFAMLIAWNVLEQPKWCKEFWDWMSTIWVSKKPEETIEKENK